MQIIAMHQAINVGAMIRQRILSKKLFRPAISKLLGSPSAGAIYNYEKRADIRSDALLRICHALQYNFFRDIAAQLPSSYAAAPHNADELLIAEQAEQIKLLLHENKILKEILMGKTKDA